MKHFKKTVQPSSVTSPALDYLIVFLAAVIPFLKSLDGEFVFDDGPAVVTNQDVVGASSLWDLLLHDFWGNDVHLPGSHKSYRPLTTLSFRVTHSLFGLSPFPFHLGNVLLHSTATCLVFWLAGRLKLKKSGCFVSAALFAIHPVHCEAVAGIVGRADVISTCLVLLGIFLWDRYESVSLTGGVTIIALMCKETGLVLPLVVFLFDLLVRHQAPSLKHLRLLGTFGLLAFLRVSFTGIPSFSSADNPLPREESSFTRWATLLYLPLFHLQLLLFPKDLCFDWTMGAVPLVSSPRDVRFWLVVTCWPLLCAFAFHIRRDYTRVFCFLFGAVSFLPASNLLIYVGFLAAERVLYLPSVAFCILAAHLMEEMCKKLDCSLVHLAAVVLVLLSARTLQGNEDWRTAENLYRNALRLNPPKAYSNLGQALASMGRMAEAAGAYEEALRYRNMADTWYNLGVLQSKLGNDTEAIRSYSTAVRLRGSFTAAHLNLGVAMLKQKRAVEAEEAFTRCIGVDGTRLKNWRMHWEAQKACYMQRANLRKKMGNYAGAREDYLAIMDSKDPLYPVVVTSLADVEARVTRKAAAILRLQNLLKSHPHHVPAILFLSRYLAESGEEDKAEHILRTSLRLLPQCVECMSELGLLIADKIPREAEELLKKASLTSSKTAHFLNYGVILQKRGKLQEAESVYKEIIQRNPKDLLALENYKKLLKAMSRKSR